MNIEIAEGLPPGAIGRIVEMHGIYYEREWNLVRTFEARVATGLGDFALRYDETSDLVLLGMKGDNIVAGLILDLNDPESGDRGAHLRFFILDDKSHGSGLGNRLLNRAMQHVDERCGGKCWLTTFGGLDAARHMYEKRGFVLTEEQPGTRWGLELTDQVFERRGSL